CSFCTRVRCSERERWRSFSVCGGKGEKRSGEEDGSGVGRRGEEWRGGWEWGGEERRGEEDGSGVGRREEERRGGWEWMGEGRREKRREERGKGEERRRMEGCREERRGKERTHLLGAGQIER